MAQLFARRTIDREVESSNPASDSDKCHLVAKGRGPLLANSTSSTEMRHPPDVSLPTLILVGMGDISIFSVSLCVRNCYFSLYDHQNWCSQKRLARSVSVRYLRIISTLIIDTEFAFQ